jgi:hypothetical protein
MCRVLEFIAAVVAFSMVAAAEVLLAPYFRRIKKKKN